MRQEYEIMLGEILGVSLLWIKIVENQTRHGVWSGRSLAGLPQTSVHSASSENLKKCNLKNAFMKMYF